MRISILMPCYNAEDTVRRSIDSILQQSYAEFEFIIVDDGSTDSTTDIIESYRDPRIKLIKLPHNSGIVHALNTGLNTCNGEYIARMDADDISLNNRLHLQKEFLDNHPDVVAVGSSIINFDNSGQEAKIEYPEQHSVILLHLLMFERSLCHPAVMYRKNAVTEVMYASQWELCEDYYLWTQLSKIGRLANIKQPLLKYFRGPLQSSNKNSTSQHKLTKKLLHEILKPYRFNNPDQTVRYLLMSTDLDLKQRNAIRSEICKALSKHTDTPLEQIEEILALKELRFRYKSQKSFSIAGALLNYLLTRPMHIHGKLMFLWQMRNLAKIKA